MSDPLQHSSSVAVWKSAHLSVFVPRCNQHQPFSLISCWMVPNLGMRARNSSLGRTPNRFATRVLFPTPQDAWEMKHRASSSHEKRKKTTWQSVTWKTARGEKILNAMGKKQDSQSAVTSCLDFRWYTGSSVFLLLGEYIETRQLSGTLACQWRFIQMEICAHHVGT